MGDNWRLDKNFQSPDGKLWSPKIFSWKCTFLTSLWRLESNNRAVLCMSQAFWRENVPDLECNEEVHLPICWKFQSWKHQSHSVAHEPPCYYCATFLAPVPQISLPSCSFFARNTYFMRNRKKTWRLATILATLWTPMEVVNRKIPFIFISKTSAG